MEQFAAARMDLADASLVALAEKLDLGRIFTLDRNDFSFYRIRFAIVIRSSRSIARPDHSDPTSKLVGPIASRCSIRRQFQLYRQGAFPPDMSALASRRPPRRP